MSTEEKKSGNASCSPSLSCASCGVKACRTADSDRYPGFCPTAGLDPKERMRFRNVISKIGFGKIVILATHIVSDIESISDDCLLLKDGRLIDSGSSESLCAKLDGCVWDIPMTEREAEKYTLQNSCANITKRDSGILVHTVSAQKPCENAQPSAVTLEDVYMSHFGSDSDE